MTKSVEQQVFDQHQEITSLAQLGNNSKIALGEHLYWMREADRYKFVAGEDATWTSYLASPEVKIPYSSAVRYMTIYRRYIKELGLKYEDLNGLDSWGLEFAAKAVTKKSVKKWLSNIRELSRNDLKVLVKQDKIDMPSHKHEWEKMPPKWKCSCGEITTVNPK